MDWADNEMRTTVSYSMLINGESHGYIPSTRCVRQDDPLSALPCPECLSLLLPEAKIEWIELKLLDIVF